MQRFSSHFQEENWVATQHFSSHFQEENWVATQHFFLISFFGWTHFEKKTIGWLLNV
jgi:hypothetical protein